MTSPCPSLVDPDSVQIPWQVDTSTVDREKVATNKREMTPTKESAKKNLSKLSRYTADEFKALDARWLGGSPD